MKKNFINHLFLVLVTLIFSTNIKAQSNLCEDPCPPGPKLWKTIPLCQVFNYPTFDGNGNAIVIREVNTVFVEIAYRIRICNGITSFIIEDYVFVDSRNFLVTIDPWFVTAIGSTPCGYPNPPTTSSIKRAIQEAIQIFLGMMGNPSVGNHDVFFKGSCNSMVVLSFPDSTFFTSAPDDLGMTDTFYVNSSSTVSQFIPCEDVCCKVTYNWQVVTLSNGETTSRWVAISSVGEGDEVNCSSQVLPDYNTYSGKLTGKKFDPISGTYIDVQGNVVQQEPCDLICPRLLAPPPPDFTTSIKSDLSKDANKIDVNASPVPFNNFLKVNSNKEILKVLIYDLNGRVLLQSNSLDGDRINTTEIKNGIYFLQVEFANDIVKTIKVIKQ